MKQPSRKPSLRESHSDHTYGDIERIIPLGEGTATDLVASVVSAIAKVGDTIQKHARSRGLKTSAKWLTDGQSMSAVIGIQLGHRRAFPNSEEISVRIFDDDNIKVVLTDNITRALESFAMNHGIELEQLSAFASDVEATKFLDTVYNGVGAVPTNL